MAPKADAGRSRGKSRSGTTNPPAEDTTSDFSDPFASDDEGHSTSRPSRATSRKDSDQVNRSDNAGNQEAEPEKSISKDLLTRILHEFFVKDTTRISKDANATVGKYVDVFVREAIARAAVERRTGFFEVEELEKVAPQLLLDL